nr:hypothetical protein [Tanacetum cinerariifolium]
MMKLVMHTEKNDTVFHTGKTGKLILVVEIDVGGMTAVVGNKVTCSSDDVQPKQVDLKYSHRTLTKVPDTRDTIKFMLDSYKFTYIEDMFHDILHLPVETPDNPFVAPVNIEIIKDFMNMKKEAIKYPCFIKLIIADLMKKFLNIPQRGKKDYHSIKDDVPLVSVYTTENVLVRGMLISNEFLTKEIRATDEFKEYETVFMNRKKRKQIVGESSSPRQSHKITIPKKKQHTTPIPPLGDDRERDKVVEATILSLTLHKTTLATKAQENIGMVQKKLDEEGIEKMVEGDGDEESYASEFTDSMLNDDKNDNAEIEKDKEDREVEKEKKDDTVEKTNKVINKKEIVDDVTGSKEIRKEQNQTPIPSPTRSPRNLTSSDKTVLEELTATVSPSTATTSKDSSITKRKKQSLSYKSKTLLGSIVVNKDHEIKPINAQEMMAKEFATYGPKMIEELFLKHMHNTTLNLYPIASLPTAETLSADLQHQLYLKRKSKPQDQAIDPEIWEILKAKFEKP